jgi:hypothetical protein
MAARIVYKKLDVEKVTLDNPYKSENGIWLLKVLYDGNPLFIQTPKMETPWAVSENKGKYNMSLSMKNEENNKDLQIFRQKMDELDQRIKSYWIEHFPEYLPINPKTEKNASKVEILLEDQFNYSIKKNKERQDGKSFPDNFRIAVSLNNEGIARASFYNMEQELKTMQDVQPYAEVCCLVSVTAFWSSGLKKYGPNYKLYQCQFKNSNNLKGFQIMNDDDENDADPKDEEEDDEYAFGE